MKLLLINILTLFFVGIALGQDPEVILSINPVSADVGEIVTITIKSNVQGDVDIDNLPSSFVQGYDVMSGMEQEMDYNSGKVITFFYISQTGAFGNKGKYTIGPAWVKKGNKTYKSNTVVVNIGEKMKMSTSGVTAQQLKDPAFGIIQTNKTKIYEGEPIVVTAKIFSNFEPTHLEGYRSYELPGTVDKKELGNAKRIIVDRENYKNQAFYTFEYDKNVVFPSGTGQFKISPYTMKLNQNYKGYQFKSNHAIIDIKPLPANPPKDFVGAVGHFSIEREIEKTKLDQGDVFKMIIRVIGSGNLQNTIEPTLILPKGFIVYGDPEIEEQYVYNSHGTEGNITYKYNIQVNKSGVTKLSPTSISFFDPNKEKYITVATNSSEIKVKEDKSFVADLQEEDDLQELNTSVFLRKSEIVTNNYSFFGSVGFWLGATTPFFVALIFLFIAKKREDNADEMQQKQVVKKKKQEVNSSLTTIEKQITTSDANEFYSQVEKALKTALEVKVVNGENFSKQELLLHVSNTVSENTISKATKMFEKCDQFRYGFTSDEDSKQAVFSDLKSVLEALKR
ncbi:MAG TPA: hypothetical protein EYG86_03960 [Crocinitomicaceae bacterium]|nr:hypothetical protein [Crocinitomicaceae bacterium]